MKSLIIKEQVIEACPRDLSIHLQERSPQTLEELNRYAEQYLKARGRQLHQGCRNDQKGKVEVKTPITTTLTEKTKGRSGVLCYTCPKRGHVTRDCKNPTADWKQASGKIGHKKEDCQAKKGSLSGAAIESDQLVENCGLGYLIIPETPKSQDILIQECIVDNMLLLANGKHLEIILNTSQHLNINKKMSITMGYVGPHPVTALGDTGCNSVVAKEKFGLNRYMIMADNTPKKTELSRIYIDTLYYAGGVEAVCLPDALCDLLIGNVKGAREPKDPDPFLEAAGITTERLKKRML